MKAICINQLAEKIQQYPTTDIYHKKGWARGIAQRIKEYCKYLQDVQRNCKNVIVTVELNPGTKFIPACEILKVKYSNGDSSMVLDEIYSAFLLPELDLILQKHNNAIRYNLKLQAA